MTKNKFFNNKMKIKKTTTAVMKNNLKRKLNLKDLKVLKINAN